MTSLKHENIKFSISKENDFAHIKCDILYLSIRAKELDDRVVIRTASSLDGMLYEELTALRSALGRFVDSVSLDFATLKEAAEAVEVRVNEIGRISTKANQDSWSRILQRMHEGFGWKSY